MCFRSRICSAHRADSTGANPQATHAVAFYIRFDFRQSPIVPLRYARYMNMYSRFCCVALELSRLHGVFFAAAFLADRGVPLAIALALLAGRIQEPHRRAAHDRHDAPIERNRPRVPGAPHARATGAAADAGGDPAADGLAYAAARAPARLRRTRLNVQATTRWPPRR